MKMEGEHALILSNLDDIVRSLEVELEGVEVEEIAAVIRREINAKIAEWHPELSAG
jgi:hypothetical protein